LLFIEERIERNVSEELPRAVEMLADAAQRKDAVIVIAAGFDDRARARQIAVDLALGKILRSLLRDFEHERLNPGIFRRDVARAAFEIEPHRDDVITLHTAVNRFEAIGGCKIGGRISGSLRGWRRRCLSEGDK